MIANKYTQTDGRIPGIDGLRAASITLVVVGHASLGLWPIPPIPSTLLTTISNGALGVSIFFVLSGFLITALLLNELQSGTISLSKFYVRRAFRIWPAFYAMIACDSILAILGFLPVTRKDFVAASLFLWNYSPSATSVFLGHTWSLAVEEQFYLIWPAAVLILKPRLSTHAAAFIILVSPLVRVIVSGGIKRSQKRRWKLIQ